MFEGFTPDDFDAYLPEKWASNMFTLPRRRVKDKLETLGRDLSAVLADDGLALVMRLSDDHPSLWNNKKVDTQWLFFSRDEEALKQLSEIIDTERTLAATLADPTPLYRHVFLGVSLNHEALEVGLRLHYDGWVDRKNLLSLLSGADGRTRFDELCRSLPDHYVIGVVGQQMHAPAEFDDAALAACVAELEGTGGWLFIGALMPRDQVAVLGPDVVESALETFRLLIPVYSFVAWSPDNDAVSMDRLVAQREQAIKASQAELDRERAEREARRQEQQALQAELRAEIEDKVRQDQAWRQREMAARRAAARAAAEKADAAWAAMKGGDAGSEPEAEKSPAEPRKDEGPSSLPQEAGASKGSTMTSAEDSSAEPRQDDGPSPLPRGAGASKGGTRAKADSPTTKTRSGTREDRRKPRPTRRGKPHRDRRPRPPDERIDPDGEVAVGGRVEVLRGFLKGRRGLVQDIDEKGEVKIAFGALSSRLARGDVAALKPVDR